jgi:PAS domain S-box-containing protein
LNDLPISSHHLTGDAPAAATPQALNDRRELALVAVERTRMPMVVSDPRQPDNPIVLANQAFLDLCGYTKEEVLGRNCRFLQGPDTSPASVAKLRQRIAEGQEVSLELLNYRRDGSSFWNNLFISPVHDDDGALLYFFASQKDVTIEHEARERKLAELRLMREVDHRAKNVLALVQGIVRMSRADSVEEYAAAVQGRVQALARAHGMLSERRWLEVPLDKLIEAELEPFDARRVKLQGPPVVLPSYLVQPIALLVYELVTNAVKHGALSADTGRVEVNWTENSAVGNLLIDWRETGGPPPLERRPAGFGSTLISAIVERQLQGTRSFDWRQEGLRGEFSVPLQRQRIPSE